MTTHVTTQHRVRSDVIGDVPDTAVRSRTSADRRGWAYAGVGAGLAGIGTIVSSSMINAVYDEEIAGDTVAIAEKLQSQWGAMFAFHSVTVVGALLLVVFAGGLFQRLRAALPEHSALPIVALAGLLGTAVVSVIGSGLDTEFMMPFAQGVTEAVDPANAALYNHWTGTIPWVWVLSGLSGVSLFLAARAGAVPRWIGRVGLVLGGLTMLLGVSPLEYLAGLTGIVWLLVTAVGFAGGDRASRRS